MKHALIDLNHAEVHKILHCLNECNHDGQLLTELRSKFEELDEMFNEPEYDTGLNNQFIVAGKVFSDRHFE